MLRMGFLSLFAFAFLIKCVFSEFNLTIVHVTDFHSHWFEFNENEKKCSPEESKAGKCFGGFPRLVTLVNDIRSKDQNVIVLSAGEFFLGRSLNAVHGWKMANGFLPYLGIDAMSLANHDFSSGMLELSAFLYGMKFPVLCANMWARETSFMYSRVNKSDILTVGEEKIGIVGYLHPDALQKSRNAVSVKFSPEIPAVQKEVKRLEGEGVNKIIALGHSGYSRDLEIAKRVKGLDIVIGGNSDIIWDDRIASTVGNIHGNYPRVHHSENEIDTGEIVKNKTLILHIPQHGKYVGKIKVTFDDDGKVIEESGEAILLDNKIKQDENLLKLLEEAILSLEVIAEHSHLPSDRETLAFATGNFEARGCRIQECSLGNLVTDAMLQAYNDQIDVDDDWKPVDAVIFNSGAIRYPLLAGPINIKDLLHSLFVGDFLPRVKLSGQTLKKILEYSIKRYDVHGVDNPGSFLQISGIRVTFSMDEKPQNRVQSILFQRNGSFKEFEPNKTYIVAMPAFVSDGGDGFPKLQNKRKDDTGKLEVIYLVDYLREMGRVTPKLDGRITLLGNIPHKRTRTSNNTSEINITQNMHEDMVYKVKQFSPNSMNHSYSNNLASFSKNMNRSAKTNISIHFNSEEKTERSQISASNESDWNYTKDHFLPSNTSLKSVSETLNSTVQDLVQTILPTLNSSTLLNIIENADSLRKGLSLDKSLENKITVTSLSPSEVTTLASNISFRHKALGTIFSSIMKEHRNETGPTKEAKLALSTQPSQSTHKANAFTEKEDHNSTKPNGRTRYTLNDTVKFVESFVGLKDLIIDSVISSLLDTVQENDTKASNSHERFKATNVLSATLESVDNHNPKNSSNNSVEENSPTTHIDQLNNIPTASKDANEKYLENGKAKVVGSNIEDLEDHGRKKKV